ncbi:MAG: NAD(+) synthase, partial [Candidatus Sungbacteria bacterium]|nr:NAD(+) synthase [Candidatus Sungbacteria bacterium]
QAELFRVASPGERTHDINIRDYLKPISVETRKGPLALGVILCEDMWHEDYALNPAKILVQQGAELIINLSASPWTWQKNQKRHRVVKELIAECGVPLVYVNATGSQNTGKNILVFDGSSAVYDERGNVVYEVAPYAQGAYDFRFSDTAECVIYQLTNDTAELYAALRCATQYMLEMLLPSRRKIIIGVSGGIDSAVSLGHFVDVAGRENVIAVNMPFVYSDPRVQSLAEQIARNLGVRYEVRPITKIVEAIAEQTGVKSGTLAYENIQARSRMEILAAMAQEVGGVFPCNANKVEIAFGYGTLYGDVAGFYAPLGDLVKREVRQIADYINKTVFGREVIPYECINQIPTAELGKNQKDPFDYGDLIRRGDHDEMVRAFTEFRKNPEWMRELYHSGKLEHELRLDSGTLARLFPNALDFVQDLTRSWEWFNISFFKRIQSPPIAVVSRRAFGRDLEESLMQPYFTQKYQLNMFDLNL